MSSRTGKWVSAAAAAAAIKSGDSVYVSGNAATPMAVLRALAARHGDLHGVRLHHLLMLGRDPFAGPGMEEHFRHNSFFVGPADREEINAGAADYVPVFLYQIPQLFSSGQVPLDAAIIQTSPPDANGFVSLGVEVLASRAACKAAKLIIAQVNDQMPRTLGDTFIRVSDIDYLVDAPEPLPEFIPAAATNTVSKAIGRLVATLIEDGSTLQLGIGEIPDATLSEVVGRKDLGIHTEMVSDGVMRAIQSGVVTGARKNLYPGKVVATFALGTRALYQYLQDNPWFEFLPVDYTNDPFLASQNDRLVAINSALEIDLTGQVCADSLGTYIYSGFGGQVDFMRAAGRSKGGKPIIAMPSTARGGAVSRIVSTLKDGAGVVTTRADVHYVVTEYGIAYLHGKNLRERARALIEIAHPEHRAMLRDAAEKLHRL